MKVTEIRIGNLWGTSGCCPQAISESDFMNMAVNGLEYPSIPITEQWLGEFGFKKRFHNSECNIWEPPPADTNTTYLAIAKLKSGQFIELISRAKVDYVHQIQNLYFALTGIELNYEINPPKE